MKINREENNQKLKADLFQDDNVIKECKKRGPACADPEYELQNSSTLHSPIKSGWTPADYRWTTMVVQWTISGLPPEFRRNSANFEKERTTMQI